MLYKNLSKQRGFICMLDTLTLMFIVLIDLESYFGIMYRVCTIIFNMAIQSFFSHWVKNAIFILCSISFSYLFVSWYHLYFNYDSFVTYFNIWQANYHASLYFFHNIPCFFNILVYALKSVFPVSKILSEFHWTYLNV